MIGKDGYEEITVRCIGGPHEGNRFVSIISLGGHWPPPMEIPVAGGKYVRKRFSNIPECPVHPSVSRGVEYEWEEAWSK